MGAEPLRTPGVTPKPVHRLSWKVITVAVFVAFLGLALVIKEIHSDGPTPRISPREEAQLERRLKEIDDSEQYALLAISSGWYPCLHSGRATCYLHAGEVWKYGVTSKGKFGRYSVAFLLKSNVTYNIQFKGNFAECLKQEQIRLFNYPYLPENLARFPRDRLPRPPYNSIMR